MLLFRIKFHSENFFVISNKRDGIFCKNYRHFFEITDWVIIFWKLNKNAKKYRDNTIWEFLLLKNVLDIEKDNKSGNAPYKNNI